MDYMYLLMFLIPMAAQIYISVTYGRYKKIKNSSNVSGYDVARRILDDNGLNDVYVVETKGILSDHFDPGANVVRLSSAVYNGNSVSSADIAAHEVGHAIQYKEGNFFMKIRKFIFPLVNISSKFGYIAIIIGLIFGLFDLVYIGIGMLFVILLFQLVTLPVEFDASRKGMANLEKYGLIDASGLRGASKVLFAAALTYVAGLATTLLEIFRLLIMVAGDRD